jgi:hypothetical protein
MSKRLIYNVITCGNKFKAVREGASRASYVFHNGIQLQRWVGWVTLNRNTKLYIHDNTAIVIGVIHSCRSGMDKGNSREAEYNATSSKAFLD